MTTSLILIGGLLLPLGVLIGYGVAKERARRERCFALQEEVVELRKVILRFVTRSRKVKEPTLLDYRALVDAVLPPSTPASIREVHHSQCGTDGETH